MPGRHWRTASTALILIFMALPRPASPRRAFADLKAFFRARGRHQLIAGTLAIILPAIIVVGFYVDGKTNLAPPRRTLIYAENWRADRTDAEIIAQQKIDTEAKAEFAREKQRAYKKLEKRLGF